MSEFEYSSKIVLTFMLMKKVELFSWNKNEAFGKIGKRIRIINIQNEDEEYFSGTLVRFFQNRKVLIHKDTGKILVNKMPDNYDYDFCNKITKVIIGD